MAVKTVLRSLLVGSIVALTGASAHADWPQYRGPNHDGVSADAKVLAKWPAEGPKVVWRIPVGEAFGSFAVKGDRAYYMAEHEKQENCVAVEAATGKAIWSTPVDRTIFERQGGNGPRTTPVIDGDRVYVLGTYLKLMCLNAADGKVIWSHDIGKDFAGQNGTAGIRQWGNAASPVVDGKYVFIGGGGAGQSIMAFDKMSGSVVWKTLDEKITHATPVPATIHGVRQVIFFMQSGLVSVKPEDGSVLWRYPFKFSVSTAASPIVAGDIVYCSAGYGVGAGAVKIAKNGDAFTATQLWRTEGTNINHWSTPVYKDGYLYGLYGFKEHGTCPLKCIDLATGKEVWSQSGFGQGGTILVGDQILVQGERGQLVLVEATPSAYKEVSRAQPLGGKCWTMAVVTNGRVYTRSTREAACLDVSEK